MTHEAREQLLHRIAPNEEISKLNSQSNNTTLFVGLIIATVHYIIQSINQFYSTVSVIKARKGMKWVIVVDC